MKSNTYAAPNWGVDTFFQGTVVQGPLCPRDISPKDFCPRRHWPKETIVQGESLRH